MNKPTLNLFFVMVVVLKNLFNKPSCSFVWWNSFVFFNFFTPRIVGC